MFRWGIMGCKPQTACIIQKAIEINIPPSVFITLPGHEEKNLQHSVSQTNCLSLVTNSPENYINELEILDVLIICRYNLLSDVIFKAPKLACLNVHSSLLPQYRGVHPVSWALIRGEKETGVTIHHVDNGIDTGPIVLQGRQSIRDDHSIWTLTEDLNILSADMVISLLQSIQTNVPEGVPQASGEYFYARRRTEHDGYISLQQSAQSIINTVRALQSPLPPAFMKHDEILFNITDCRIIEKKSKHAAGTILQNGTVQCRDAILQINTDTPLPKQGVLS